MLNHFKIHLEPNGDNGTNRVIMDGQDLTDTMAINAIGVKYAANGMPEVILHVLSSEVELDLDGRATVVRPEGDIDYRQEMVDLLDDLDPDEVERLSLQNAGLSQSPTETMLEAIKDLLRA